MKKYLFLLLLPALLIQSCVKDKITHTYSIWTPVYKLKTEVYANIKSNTPRDIVSPGKIFLYGNYIFLNEVDKGVHVIDNSNPSQPVVKAFIDIPGNVDIAVKGNTLYADLYSDMVVVDISNPMDARFVKFVPQVFPERSYYQYLGQDNNRVIVDWVRKDTTVRVQPRGSILYDVNGSPQALYTFGTQNNSQPIGIAGSMSRFALVNNYLYAVNYSKLETFNISDNTNPVLAGNQQIGWQIETIYPFRDHLFIGSMNGMYIYDISNPAAPVSKGQYTHVRSCDPVIADDQYAYVTLRSGTPCAGFTNQLEVLNISNLMSPSLLTTVNMTNPHGLAKDNNLLFICDGRSGIKVYDVLNPLNPVLKQNITGIDTYDAIAWNNNLLVVASDGLYQYNYAGGTLTQRSKLSVKK